MVDLCSLAKHIHSFVFEFLMGLMALHHLFIGRKERAQLGGGKDVILELSYHLPLQIAGKRSSL